MQFEIEGNPDFGQLTVGLEPGELFLAESGSMAFMSDGTELKSKLIGGFAGSFLAATPGIILTTKFVSLGAIFSGEGAFTIVASGEGDLFFNAYGAIIEKQVDGSLIVDSGHAVAWDPGLKYNVTTIGGAKSTLLSGEGIVLNFTGTGTVYIQTRTLNGVARWRGRMYH